MEKAKALWIFDTHPIQYRAPLFKLLHEKTGRVQVFYFNEAFNPHRWWFQEKGKHSKENFGLNLQEGYPQKVLNTDKLSLFGRFSLFRKLLKPEKPEAVLIYGYYQPEHWLLRFWCAHYHIPILFVGETFDWRGSFLRKVVKRLLVSYFFKGVSGFISVGEKTASYYRSWNVDAKKITQARYCTDTAFFVCDKQKSQALRSETRQNLGIPESAFVILFVGRLFNRKRPEDFLKIHEVLAKKHSVYALVVGQGELKESLQKKYPDAKVNWLGFKTQKELKGYYHAADLIVVPSEFETWGLVVNEAFSCGLPAIATETCGVSGELLQPGINGETFSVGDISRAIEVIEGLIENPSKRGQWGERAKEKVISEYQPDQFAGSIMRAWNQLASVES